MSISPAIAERIARIELLVLDVDGVLTDGSITYCGGDTECKTFHVRDGMGIRYWGEQGKQTAILSGRASEAVRRRARELRIDTVIEGAETKLTGLREILDRTGTHVDRVCAIGDDLPDLPVLRSVGLAIAVADACPEVREAADWVTSLPGGRGAVRELIELLLRGQDLWEPLVNRLRRQRLKPE